MGPDLMKGITTKLTVILVLTLVCSFAVYAQDQAKSADSDLTGLNHALEDAHALPSSPLAPAGRMAPFSLGERDKPQLRLQLSEPLFFEAGSLPVQTNNGSNVTGISGVLGADINDQVSVGVGVRKSIFEYQPEYTTLGDIRCENGTLAEDSYRASNCRFVSDGFAGDRMNDELLNIGAQWSPSGQFLVGLNYFQQQAELTAGQQVNMLNPAPYSPSRPAVSPLRQIMPWEQAANPLNGIASRSEGVDVNLQLGFTTNEFGSLQLGLQFSRIIESEFSTFSLDNGTPLRWLPAEPFNTAQMNLDWTRGDFSGGIQGFYRGQVDMGEYPNLNGLSSFDLYFTWRTPWNADLSVGATNLLNSGTDSKSESNPEQFDDPFEMIYGRVPYVRYKQDL